MVRKNLPLVIALAVLVLGLFVYLESPDESAEEISTPPVSTFVPLPVGKTYPLTEQNNSKIEGYLLVRELEGKVHVKINFVTPETEFEEENVLPAAIYAGTCSNLGAVKYNLAGVVDGGSETFLPGTTEDFKKNVPLSVAVFATLQSPRALACGEIDSY